MSLNPQRRTSSPPGQGRPGQGRPGQGRPGQGRPGQGRPGQGRPRREGNLLKNQYGFQKLT